MECDGFKGCLKVIFNPKNFSDSLTFNVIEIKVHPDYNVEENVPTNDIAALKLESSVESEIGEHMITSETTFYIDQIHWIQLQVNGEIPVQDLLIVTGYNPRCRDEQKLQKSEFIDLQKDANRTCSHVQGD